MKNQSPVAYSKQRLIFDHDGNVVDCVFLEVNSAFEKITGFSIDSIIGKSVNGVLPEIRTGHFDWVFFFSNIVGDGTGETYIQFKNGLNRWYKVTAVSMDSSAFVTIFQDVSEAQERVIQLERQKEEIESLTEDINTVFNNVQDALVIMKVENGEIRYVRNNIQHQRLTGLSSEGIYGKTLIEVWGGKTGGEQTEKYTRMLPQRLKEHVSEEMLKVSDSMRYFRKKIAFVYKNEAISYLIEVTSDITAEKKLYLEKEELLKRFQAMFDANSAPMLIVDPETQLIVDANPAALSYFFRDPEKDSVQKHVTDICMLSAEEIQTIYQHVLQGNRGGYQTKFRDKNDETRVMEVFLTPIPFQNKTCLFSILIDRTEGEEFREQLQKERDLLHITLSSIGDGVVTTDHQGRITYMNRVSEQITGWEEDEVQGKLFSEAFRLENKTTGQILDNPVDHVLNTGRPAGLADNTVMINRQGDLVPIADSAAPIRDKEGTVYGVVMVFRDVSAEKEQEEEILYLSYHDALTGLYNRRYAEEEIQRLDTQGQLPLAVIMGDVNGLKITNDIFGHSAGDDLLKAVAGTIQDCCRPEDVVARWGGDEFLILLPRTELTDAQNLIGKIKETLAQKKSGELPLSLSLGCGVKASETEDIRQALSFAEERMYQTKVAESTAHQKRIIRIMLSMRPETRGHSERLRRYCLRMGQALGFSQKELDNIAVFAELHDIGKVAIPREVLLKTSPLTPEDWEEIKHHSTIGYRIALSEPEFFPVAESILSHHEHWDGKGYPRGIGGTDIPRAARILAVADAYDSMTNNQIFRKAMDKAAALQELQRCAGTQFDPELVDLFVRLFSASPSDHSN